MVHNYCFETLDITLRDILLFSNPRSLEQPFGDKVIVFGGDFRQILQVIPKDSRQDIISAATNSFYLWNYCDVQKLTKNMRLQSHNNDANMQEIRNFSNWILIVGDGNIGESNDGEVAFQISDDLLIKDGSDPVGCIINSTYPFSLENLWGPKYLQERAILASPHDVVDVVMSSY